MILMMASASPSWLCITPYCSENVYIEQLMHSQDGGHITLSSIRLARPAWQFRKPYAVIILAHNTYK